MNRSISLFVAAILLVSVGFLGISCKAVQEESAIEETAEEVEETAEEVEETPEEVEETAEEETEGPKQGGILRVGSVSKPEHLDNHTFGSNYVLILTNVMNGFLWQWNSESNGFIPQICEKWAWEDEGKTILAVDLREDVKFHNGEDLTAKDVESSFKRIMDPDVGSGHAAALAKIDSIEVIDDYSLKIYFSSFDASFMDAATRIAIYPKSIIESDPESLKLSPIGSGPFKFKEHIQDSKLVYEKFDDYFIDGYPYLDEIEFIFFVEAATASIALENNELDMIEFAEAEMAINLPEKNPEIISVYSHNLGNEFICLNMTREPLKSNKNLRKAIRYAIDPRSFAINFSIEASSMLTSLQSNPAYSRTEWEWNESWYDLEKAKQYLADAGYPNGDGLPTFEAVAPNTNEAFMAELLQAQLSEIGINVEALVLDVPEAVAKWQDDDYDFGCLGLLEQADPYFVLKNMFTPEGAFSWIGRYDYNDDLIALIEQIGSETDLGKRDELIIEAWDLILEEVPTMYLHDVVTPYILWDYVENLVLMPNRFDDYSGVWLDK